MFAKLFAVGVWGCNRCCFAFDRLWKEANKFKQHHQVSLRSRSSRLTCMKKSKLEREDKTSIRGRAADTETKKEERKKGKHRGRRCGSCQCLDAAGVVGFGISNF